MTNLILLSQIVIAVSVYYVWIFRYFNVIKEFEQFGLSDVTRNFVGAAKISMSALLLVGIWFPDVIIIAAGVMGFFMIGAQFFHFKIKNSFIKHLPSLILLILCMFLVWATSSTF
jgi:DoxX-like family